MTSDDDTGTICHTSFFFRTDESNFEIAYCKICERANQNPYPYSHKGGNTSNLIAHLRDKHGIIKENYTEYLDVNNEPQVVQTSTRSTCSPERQELFS
ncbi:hypothetical protein RhiirA4_412068 [Rhizophagus irregularis]|uniref:BED-type domain-containing protein n=1 Tax=Rhizophagus irregularis TaxID=588596 RepID=A0A2I1HHE4_9GLOM|nr:hypothetical protein RhiirA4_412068 [Rhizophagus irregularis]